MLPWHYNLCVKLRKVSGMKQNRAMMCGYVLSVCLGSFAFACAMDDGQQQSWHDAITNRDSIALRVLINSKANIDKDALNMALARGCTVSFIEQLIVAKADVNAVDDVYKSTPLRHALDCEVSDKVLELLLTYGADPDLVSGKRCSPLQSIENGIKNRRTPKLEDQQALLLRYRRQAGQ